MDEWARMDGVFLTAKIAKSAKEVLKFGSSEVRKFGLAPVPNHPQVINRQAAKDAKGNREMGANGRMGE